MACLGFRYGYGGVAEAIQMMNLEDESFFEIISAYQSNQGCEHSIAASAASFFIGLLDTSATLLLLP